MFFCGSRCIRGKQTDSPRHHRQFLLLQQSSLLGAELPLLPGPDAFIRAEHPGVEHPALPGTDSTERAYGMDQETAHHVVTFLYGEQSADHSLPGLSADW